jgi:hypothetical protein
MIYNQLNNSTSFSENKYSKIFVIIFFFFSVNLSAQFSSDDLIYLFPKPGSHYNSIHSQLMIRTTNPSDLKNINIDLVGSLSGEINFTRLISSNTLIIKPDRNLAENEKISVVINESGEPVYSYFFRTTKSIEKTAVQLDNNCKLNYEQKQSSNTNVLSASDEIKVINGVSVPSDFPTLTPSINKKGAYEGKIFISNLGVTRYIMIFENDGTPYYYKKISNGYDILKLQPNNKLSYHKLDGLNQFYAMDSTYTIVDSFKCTEGYETDGHDFTMLPNGNYFIIANRYREFDMSQIVEGGKENALLYDNDIQEFDKDHNLIFQWNCADHFDVLDAQNVKLTLNTIDWVHMNSVDVDYDGNLIISSRNQSEVTKIDRQTGELIWRFSTNSKNQFELWGDDPGINYQHDARPVKGKPNYYTIFDNGTFRTDLLSRAVEFKLDTTNMQAINVWEYRGNPTYYSSVMGNAQRLPNGNTVINWVLPEYPKLTEVNTYGEIFYQANFDDEYLVYRTLKFDWEGKAEFPYLIVENNLENVSLIYNHFGDSTIANYIIYSGKSADELIPMDTVSSTTFSYSDLENYTEYYFAVASVNSEGLLSPKSNTERVLTRYTEEDGNFIINGDFDEGLDFWDFDIDSSSEASVNYLDSQLHLAINNGGDKKQSIKISQKDLPLSQDQKYVLEFEAYSDQIRTIGVAVESSTLPTEDYSRIGNVLLETELKNFKYQFDMTRPFVDDAVLFFYCGNSDADVYIDNISLKIVTPTDIDENEFPDFDFRLYQNYPNPFNPSTVIEFNIPNHVGDGLKPFPANVNLSVYDVLGRKVTTLVNKQQSPGHYKVSFDASNLSSGIYFYQLRIGNKSLSKKMILLR